MKPKRGAGLFARAPKGEPVSFSMICSASSSRRLICMCSAKDFRQEVQRRSAITSRTRCCRRPLGLAAASGCSGASDAGTLPCTSSYFSRKRWSIARSPRGSPCLRVKHPVGLPLDQTAADRPLHRCPCII